MNSTTKPTVGAIESVSSPEALVRYLAGLGYRTRIQGLHIPDLGLPEGAQNLMRESLLLADYDRNFQIYFVRTSSMRRTDFRTILEPFYRRYPQGNYLFVFTSDWEEIAFVSPERVAIEPGKTKLRLRILFVDRSNVYHTDLEVLRNIAVLPTEQRADLIWQKHLKAFNVERVTHEFFEAYKFALNFMEGELLSQNRAPYQKVHSFAQQLLSRIMFLYFVQKKGWLKWKDYVQDKRYTKNLWEKYKKHTKKRDSFYSDWLCCLFFYALNGPGKHAYIWDFDIPNEIKESFITMPFLNGGLFAENELDKIGFEVPDKVFELLFEIDPLHKEKGFLERYNFTIREDTPLEVEVAVDPEMLGKVYESLISEEERGRAGIFYTPRIEIDYMCRLSLTEYVHDATGIPKETLIPFVFEPFPPSLPGQGESSTVDSDLLDDQLRKVESALDKVRIVDPAVGSASFLVGMMNVLTELHRCINKRFDREVNEFDLKSKVIRENLYGVDVKDWAVMVGELRLWLSLIIETEEKELIERVANIYQHPLLPNLTFKMRQGDSLVEEIAGVPVSLRREFQYIPERVKRKITELMSKKASYFASRSADLSEKEKIESLENELFRDIVGAKTEKLMKEIAKLERQIRQIRRPVEQMELIKITPEQENLFKQEEQRIKKRIEDLKQERQRFQKIFENIGEKTAKDYFLWEIDFAEIFNEKGGFDIVIGNPPYVRQEKVAPPLETEERQDAETWRAKKREYKDRLDRSVKTQWGNFIKIDKKSDLYVYFYYHGLALLRPGGVFCFINSNSWLDVGYGAPLQEFLLKNLQPLYIIDNQAKRSFKESDVNTVIVAIKRPKKMGDNPIRFVTYKKPFDEVLNPENLIEIEGSPEVRSTEDYRVFPITRKELLKDGVELPEEETLLKEPAHLPYIGSKWGGKYLRAPDIFFKILEKGEGKLVRLGDIAEVYPGCYAGINDFFYLTFDEAKQLRIEDEFLIPLIRSPEQAKAVRLCRDSVRTTVFACSMSKNELHRLKKFGALDYIIWGENQVTRKRQKTAAGIPWPKVETVKRRKPGWWSIPNNNLTPTTVFMLYVMNDRFICPLVDKPVVTDRCFHRVFPRGKFKYELASILNSTTCAFYISTLGRWNLGQGAMKFETIDAKQLLVLNPSIFTSTERERLLSAFERMATREIKSIFEELGLPKPNRDYSNIDSQDVSLDKVMPDRRELDRIIFEALGLTEEEQLEVYRAVVELVKNRLVKARSV
nr:hypothetical protein [Desulfobacterales bacterium]